VNLSCSSFESVHQRAQFLDVLSKLVNSPKGVGDIAQRAFRIAVELRKPSFEPLELRAEDQRAGATLLQELPQLGLGDRARWLLEDVAEPFSQDRVELQPHSPHSVNAG
jgi:hypothetical protein